MMSLLTELVISMEQKTTNMPRLRRFAFQKIGANLRHLRIKILPPMNRQPQHFHHFPRNQIPAVFGDTAFFVVEARLGQHAAQNGQLLRLERQAGAKQEEGGQFPDPEGVVYGDCGEVRAATSGPRGRESAPSRAERRRLTRAGR